MVRPFPNHITGHVQPGPLALGLFVSIFALVALCAKRASNSPKLPSNDDDNSSYDTKSSNSLQINYTLPKSALSTPKRLLSNISTLSRLKISKKSNKGDNVDHHSEGDKHSIDGEGGIWQKDILMGEKCQPLEYAGVIYYDSNGNRTQIRRSPRVSNVISHQRSFSFPESSSSSVDVNSQSLALDR